MEQAHIRIIGFIAGTMTTVSFIPQIIKIIKTKQVRDISLVMYIVLTTGISLWLLYGVMIREMPIIAANSIAFILCFFVVIAKIRYKDRT